MRDKVRPIIIIFCWSGLNSGRRLLIERLGNLEDISGKLGVGLG